MLSVVGLFSITYGIQNASSDGWASPNTWGYIVVGVLILLGFGYYELKSTHPSIDLSLFKIRSFSVPLTGVTLAFAAMQGTLLFLTFYYQIVRGWSPLQAGLLVLPFAVGQLLGAPRSAKMVNRFGARTVITTGLIFALAGMLCFGFVSQDTPVWFLVILGVVFGFGLGNTIAPSTTRMTLATPPERSGAGSAVQNTVRQIGAVFGVAILSSVVGTVYSNNITPLIADKGLPPEALAAATDSIGGTTEVAGCTRQERRCRSRPSISCCRRPTSRSCRPCTPPRSSPPVCWSSPSPSSCCGCRPRPRPLPGPAPARATPSSDALTRRGPGAHRRRDG